MNEHTDMEELNVDDCYGTVQLIKAIFVRGKELRSVVREIRRDERKGI